jgi:hypothetical protein
MSNADETPEAPEESAAPPSEPSPPAVSDDASEKGDGDDEFDEFGPPFEARSFGGEFVWANAPGYTAKILRVRPGENVVVSTQGRRDMFAMLTGGRGVLEVRSGDSMDRVELVPASPVHILPDNSYRLIAMTEVELFTIYSPLS